MTQTTDTLNLDTEETLTLSDDVISHIAKLLQIAILSGTDVVDHLRMIRLKNNSGMLVLNENYANTSDDNIETMLLDIENLKA
jgi:hypothetical protein